MTRNFHRWEVDPFFSAAEEVQDSADRLESVYRTWIHAKSAYTGANESVAIEYHRRELSTALGTAKWQLEEFERAVSYFDTDEQRGAAEDAPTRHKQFVDALQKQINSIEKSLLNSGDNRDLKALPVVRLGQEEKDDLAIFLSGSRVNFQGQSFCVDIKKTGVCASSTPSNGISNEETCCTSSESVKSKNEVSDCFSTTASNSDTALSKVDFQRSDICCKPHALGFDGDLKSYPNLEVFIDQNNKFLFERGHPYSDGGEISAMSGNGHHRSLSASSGASFWRDDSADKGKVKGIMKGFNSTLKFWSPFAKKLGAFKLRMSKSGLKRWKDGDTDSKDLSLMAKSTDEASDLEKVYESPYIGETSKCYSRYALGGGVNGNKTYFKRWSEALRMLQYVKEAFSTNRAVHSVCAIVVASGFAGLIFVHVASLGL